MNADGKCVCPRFPPFPFVMLTKHMTVPAVYHLLGAIVLVVAGSAKSAEQTIVPAQVLRVKQVYKPAVPDSGPWTIEVENTSQSVITAYGVSYICHYPDGTTKNSGVTFDLGPLLAGQAGILAEIEYLRSAKPEVNFTFNRGADPSFGPGATRRDTFSPQKSLIGLAPDSVTAAPVSVIMDDGRAAGDPDILAGVFYGRREEQTRRTLLIEDLRLIQDSVDTAAKLEERLSALATTRTSPVPVPKLLPGQTSVLLDNPESRRAWRREQLVLLRGQAASSDSAALKAAILRYEAEAAVFASQSAYAGR